MGNREKVMIWTLIRRDYIRGMRADKWGVGKSYEKCERKLREWKGESWEKERGKIRG